MGDAADDVSSVHVCYAVFELTMAASSVKRVEANVLGYSNR